MIDPSLTAVWRRRVVAALVDLGIVLGVLAALVVLQVERFTRDAAGIFTPEAFDRMAALRQLPNRYVELGDTRYVLAGAELVMTLLVTALVALAVYVVLPASTGHSPGKRLSGLQVVTAGGEVIGLSHALVRTAVGVVDLLPVVVPWGLGAAVARRSPLWQRLGDRVAGTVVVDARRPLLLAAPAGGAAATTGPTAAPAGRAGPGGDGPAGAAAPEAPVAPAGPAAPVGPPAAVGAGAGPSPTRPTPGPRSTPGRAPGGDPGQRSPGPDLFAQPVAARPRSSARPAAPPQHRATAAATAVPVAALPATRPAGLDVVWERPRAEPAPVWDPAGLGAWLRPDEGAAGGGPEPELPEPPALPAPAAADPGAGTADPGDQFAPPPAAAAAQRATAPEPNPEGGAAPAPPAPAEAGGQEPVWDEGWQAWLYFDHAAGRWQRHDPASGTWEPIG